MDLNYLISRYLRNMFILVAMRPRILTDDAIASLRELFPILIEQTQEMIGKGSPNFKVLDLNEEAFQYDMGKTLAFAFEPTNTDDEFKKALCLREELRVLINDYYDNPSYNAFIGFYQFFYTHWEDTCIKCFSDINIFIMRMIEVSEGWNFKESDIKKIDEIARVINTDLLKNNHEGYFKLLEL